MELRRRNPRASTHDSDAVKAAAWAWYEHGSGSDQCPGPSEFGITRTQRDPKPTRYRLEAMRKALEESACAEGSSSTSTCSTPSHADDRNSLLDSYEIRRISQDLDYLIESSKANSGYGRPLSLESDPSFMMMKTRKKKKNNNILRGLWPGLALMCGSRDDVHTGVLVLRQRPENPKKLTDRRPRVMHVHGEL